jgi:hypothetical protein
MIREPMWKPMPFAAVRLAVVDAINRLLRVVIEIAARYFAGRFAFLKIAAVAVLLSLLTTYPGYYRDLHKGISRPAADPDRTMYDALNFKFHHPLTPIPADLKDVNLHDGVASHIDKLDLRLTIPILGWLSGTGIWTIIVWNHLSGFGVFYLLARLAARAISDTVSAALFVLALAPTFFGSVFFNDTQFGDGVSFFFLLLSVATRHPAVSFCSFVAAAFSDERCVTAAPLLLLYFFVRYNQDNEIGLRIGQCAAIVAGAVVWWLLRMWAARAFHLTMGTSMLMTPHILEKNFSVRLPGPFLGVFKGLWTLPAVAALALWTAGRRTAALVFLASFACSLAPAFVVADFERSVCYSFPVLLVSAHFLGGDPEGSRKYLAGILVTNLLLISPLKTVLRAPFHNRAVIFRST